MKNKRHPNGCILIKSLQVIATPIFLRVIFWNKTSAPQTLDLWKRQQMAFASTFHYYQRFKSIVFEDSEKRQVKDGRTIDHQHKEHKD
jgi:hypothetical protein